MFPYQKSCNLFWVDPGFSRQQTSSNVSRVPSNKKDHGRSKAARGSWHNWLCARVLTCGELTCAFDVGVASHLSLPQESQKRAPRFWVELKAEQTKSLLHLQGATMRTDKVNQTYFSQMLVFHGDEKTLEANPLKNQPKNHKSESTTPKSRVKKIHPSYPCICGHLYGGPIASPLKTIRFWAHWLISNNLAWNLWGPQLRDQLT